MDRDIIIVLMDKKCKQFEIDADELILYLVKCDDKKLVLYKKERNT